MSKNPIDLTGSPSHFCISQQQMIDAHILADGDLALTAIQSELEEKLNRNQQAALAFVLIDKLLQSQ